MKAGKIPAIVVLLLSFLILPDSVQAKYSGGSGTAGDPYKIANAADLLAMAANTSDYNKHFILTADIDLASSGTFTTAVIAPDTDNSNYTFDGTAFTGVFDGNGHTISKLTINTSGAGNDYLSLFGEIGSGGQIKNLVMKDVNITGGDDSYGLGGLTGDNDGNISNCYSTGAVAGGEHHSWDVGGLVGWNYGGTISNCYSTGVVTDGNGAGALGGLVGGNSSGTISNCYSTGAVTGGNISGSVGGMVGMNGGTISNCYSTGNVAGGNNSGELGGLVGGNISSGTISNCYSTGAVAGGNDSGDLGGLTGGNIGNISNCYSTGAVSGGTGSSDLGGLVGSTVGGNISNCYFPDTEPNNGLGTPLTDAQMKQQSSFIGWDFVTTWTICEGISYPKLAWLADAGGLTQVTKCTVTAGKKANSDKISFSGTMDATADELSAASSIEVTIDSNDMVNPCVLAFLINDKTFKNSRYSYSGTENGIRKSFTYNPETGKFSLAASNVELLGLGCPVTVEIEIGDYIGVAEVNETIVNGPRVPIPIKLMMGVKDVLRVDNHREPGKKQLSVSGGFAVEDPNVSMANRVSEGLVVTLGTQQFTIPANKLKAGKEKFTCSRAQVTEGGIAAANFNFGRCSFILTIKKMTITAGSGTVDFGVAFAGYSQCVQITLP